MLNFFDNPLWVAGGGGVAEFQFGFVNFVFFQKLVGFFGVFAGQDDKKAVLGEGKSPKGYREGLAQGRKNTQKEIKELFDKYLTYDIKGKPGKIKQRKYDEFTAFLNENKAEEEDEI